jgi:peptide deformylase
VVERAAEVRIQGYTPSGEPVALEASGMLSRALQHEIDHLDGVLFVDRVSPLKRKLLLKKWKKKMEEEVSV